MRNKRGQFFAIYLVLLTLFMCGMAIWIYYMQNKTVDNSLASPVSVLELQDKQELFNLQERDIAIVSARESGLANNRDVDAFKTKFFDYLANLEQKQFRDFIFSNLTFDGKPDLIVVASDSEKIDFLRKKGVYSFSVEDKSLKVERKHLGKTFLVRAPDKSVINFIVFVDYSYDKSYLIPFKETEEFGK